MLFLLLSESLSIKDFIAASSFYAELLKASVFLISNAFGFHILYDALHMAFLGVW